MSPSYAFKNVKNIPFVLLTAVLEFLFHPGFFLKKGKKCLRNLDLSFKAYKNEINYAQGLGSGCGFQLIFLVTQEMTKGTKILFRKLCNDIGKVSNNM